MTILVAIDDSAAARSVIDVARRLGTLLGADVEAVHIQGDGDGQVAIGIAGAAHVPLHLGSGEVVTALRADALERNVDALVIGIRSAPPGVSPTGRTAFEIVQLLDCTIVVVPPDVPDRPLERVLVAVDGNGVSHGLRGLFDHLGERSAPEVIALHVLESHELPMFSDSPVLEAEAFEREFMIRVGSTTLAEGSHVRLETRIGEPAAALRDAARELDVDLIVVVWHRNLADGHGRLVHDLLAVASAPLVLLPLEPQLPD